MIERRILKKIKSQMKNFPVITLTGTRQCGKSTLLREALPEFEYVSLEDPDIRRIAVEDGRGFIDSLKHPVIIDEAQYAPRLFSYIQTFVDKSGKMGQIILSGSHNFLLMESISQSLAGRAAVLRLAPFSIEELGKAEELPSDVDQLMYLGQYPRIYDKHIDPADYFPSLIQTYIERDVRLIRNIPDSDLFRRFLYLTASRSAQVVNITELSASLGISQPTVRAWLSILKESYIIFSLPPYFKNLNKRLVKSGKLYFYDTGLLCYLLGIDNPENLKRSEMRGAVFETLMISEYMKSRIFEGAEPRGFFIRDTNQKEIDLLTEDGGIRSAYEIKASSEMNMKYLSNMKRMAELLDISPEYCNCIYAGDRDMSLSFGNFIGYTGVKWTGRKS